MRPLVGRWLLRLADGDDAENSRRRWGKYHSVASDHTEALITPTVSLYSLKRLLASERWSWIVAHFCWPV